MDSSIHQTTLFMSILTHISSAGAIIDSWPSNDFLNKSQWCWHEIPFLSLHLLSSIDSLQGYHEKRLLNHLLNNYNLLERPVANESDPLEVRFGLTLQQIIDVVSWQCLRSFFFFWIRFSFKFKLLALSPIFILSTSFRHDFRENSLEFSNHIETQTQSVNKVDATQI